MKKVVKTYKGGACGVGRGTPRGDCGLGREKLMGRLDVPNIHTLRGTLIKSGCLFFEYF